MTSSNDMNDPELGAEPPAAGTTERAGASVFAPDTMDALANDPHERTEQALRDAQATTDGPPRFGTDAQEADRPAESMDTDAAVESVATTGAARDETVAASEDTDPDARAATSESEDADTGAAQPDSDASDASGEESNRLSPEEFAAEHDPANHDIAAGEEFRQPGDWTADDAGGPQVWDAEGTLVAEGEGAEEHSTRAGGERRVSEFEEVVDGGYSVGSAAPIHDDAMPLGHPVMAWEDTKTYVTEGHAAYGSAEPHVWFTDAEAAEAAGFRHVD